MREKRKYLSTIGSLMPRAIRAPGASAHMRQWRLLARWEQIVGDAVAKHARPARWRGKALIVRVDHHTWMTELAFLKPQVMERLKVEFPDITISEIRFESGELPPLPERMASVPHRQKPAPLSADDQEFIERSIERIWDDDVRDAARQAMMRGFERKRSG